MRPYVLVHTSKWASVAYEKHHKCKLQVMSTTSVSYVFALVDKKNTTSASYRSSGSRLLWVWVGGWVCGFLCMHGANKQPGKGKVKTYVIMSTGKKIIGVPTGGFEPNSLLLVNQLC